MQRDTFQYNKYKSVSGCFISTQSERRRVMEAKQTNISIWTSALKSNVLPPVSGHNQELLVDAGNTSCIPTDRHLKTTFFKATHKLLHYIKVYDLPDMILYALNSSVSAASDSSRREN